MGIVGGTLCGGVIGGGVGGSVAYGFIKATETAARRAEDPELCDCALAGARRCGVFGGSAGGATVGAMDAIYHKYTVSADNANCKE